MLSLLLFGEEGGGDKNILARVCHKRGALEF